MTRALLAIFFLASLVANGQVPSQFTFYVHDTTGKAPDTPPPQNYQSTETTVGDASPTVLRIVNSSQNTIFFVIALVSTAADSPEANPNFSVTGVFQDETLGPGGSALFTVNFTPASPGLITGFLNVAFQIQQGGCIFTSSNPSQQCPSSLLN